MTEQRWLRIIPIALIMYTISYVDRTNVSLALDPTISSMMKDLFMDDRMKGEAAGIFFFGYVALQVPGGYWATRWSPRKLISLFLISWGLCAVGCGLARSFRQFEVMRFLLGVAESGVFPATLVLLANWFPRHERARANGAWSLCQPLAVAGSAPLTGWLLGVYGWQKMLILEGIMPFLWLPLWWFCISDHPRQAKWISPQERDFLETTLQREAAALQVVGQASRPPCRNQGRDALRTGETPAPLPEPLPSWRWSRERSVWVLIAMYFLQNCAVYGCMTFFTSSLKGMGFTGLQYGVLFAVPYALTAFTMVLNSWHSDRTRERRGHVASVYLISGVSLVLSVGLKEHFWLSYALMCLAIPGPFAGMGPFWAIPSETLPRGAAGLVVGLVNAFGNLGGFAGPYIAGWLKHEYQSLAVAFSALGVGLLVAAALAFLLPKADTRKR